MYRKKILPLLAAVFMTLLTSCGNASDMPQTEPAQVGTVTTVTTATREETAVTEEAFPVTTPRETVSETESTEREYVDMYGVEGVRIYVGDYEDFEISVALRERIPGWRQEHEITGWYYGYAEINGYRLISTYSGWFPGNTQTAHVIVEKDGVVTEIGAGNIHNLSQVYYVENGVLYSFEDTLSAGITRFVLGEFDLDTGEKIRECGDIHSLNGEPDFFSDDPEIDSMEKLKEHIRDISPVWYRTYGGQWETLDEE